RDREEGSHEQGAIEVTYYIRVPFDLDEAIKAGQVIVERYPNHFYRWDDLANSYTAAGQLEDALEAKLNGLRARGSRKYPFAVASAYIELGRLDEAKADLDRQLSEGRKDTGLYHQLWRIAFLEGDQEAMQQYARQIEEDPGEDGMFFLQLQEAFYGGRFQEGRQILDDFTVLIYQQERSELADRLRCEQAWVEGIVGNEDLVSNYLDTPVDVESIHLDQVIGSAYTLALMGKSQQVEKMLSTAMEMYPEATLLQNLHAPTLRAMIEHRRGNSQAAEKHLRSARRYEQSPEADKFKLIRGLILLDLKRCDKAAEAFKKVVDYPGQIVRYSYGFGTGTSWIEIPVAQVGLARAQVMMGDIAGARKAYEDFFEMWKDADPDIPLLQEAKAEYARLQAGD
ncbi:MAG: tetratricopeptide repeat protein, partial [bacterium]